MFLSLTNSFSLQILHPISKRKMMWEPIKDRQILLNRLKNLKLDDIYRIVGMNYLSVPIMITHKFCKRMIWGNEGFGKGVKESPSPTKNI